MSGGDDTPADRKVISLKLLVDKARNRVIFAESDHEFIDTLLSFLTLPIGSVVRLLGPDSTAIGSLTTMYNSVSSLESRHLRTDYCKDMLLNPSNATETQCSELKINVDPLEPVKLYRCNLCLLIEICQRESGETVSSSVSRQFSTIKDRPCRCKRHLMSARVEVGQAEKGAQDDCEGGGVFVNDGAFSFMITDDLQVMAGSTAACLSLFRKLGIDDGNEVEERTLEFGEQEVLCLLKFALLSKSPLTEAILYIQCSSEKERIKFQPKRTPQPDKNAGAANTNNMTLKLFASKSKEKVLYAEAGVDVVDFLFSILTYPLGSIIKLLGKNSGFGCMDNLYKTVEDLGTGGYLKSEEHRKMLLCPKLAPFHSIGNQLLQIEEASYPLYAYDHSRDLWVAADQLSEENRLSAVVMDPKSPTGEVDAGKGYMKGPRTFMILNDLSVAPLSPVTSVALLNQMNVPINDVVERLVTIGPNEALNLLNASLISKTVLSDVFNQREPYPEVIMRPPRGVRGRGGGLGRGLPEAHPHEEEEVVHEGEFEATKVMCLPPRVLARGGRGQGRGRGQAEVEDAIVEDIPEDEEVIGRWPRVRGGGRGWGSGLPKAQPQEEVFGPPPRGRGGYRGRGRGGYRGRGSGLPEAQPLEEEEEEEEEEVVHEDESEADETWIDGHPRVGFGEAPVRGCAREEEVLTVLEVVDSVVGDTGLGAMELRAALQEVQAILRPKAVVYSKRGVGASGRG